MTTHLRLKYPVPVVQCMYGLNNATVKQILMVENINMCAIMSYHVTIN